MSLKYRTISDNLFEISFKDASTAQKQKKSCADALRSTKAFEEVVSGANTIVLQMGPNSPTSKQLPSFVENNISQPPLPLKLSQKTLTIPVVYGGNSGPDLTLVCEHLKVTEPEFISVHTDQEHEIDMIGFTPGFAYIQGTKFNMPRLTQPRLRVAAGSIGLASGLTGIYSLEGPGGWPIIGRTQMPLIMPAQEDPFILETGMKIRFKSVRS